MKTQNNLYPAIISKKNLVLAWKKARKGKTQKNYVVEFEKSLPFHFNSLNEELNQLTYSPKPLKLRILRDPKTRKISISDFRDRIIHHALCNIIEPIFDKTFIYDNCASRVGKGGLFALKRFEIFRRKITCNFTSNGFCLKADIKHYFEEINHEILLEIIKRKIKCEKTIWLIKQIMQNKVVEERERERETHDSLLTIKGMPLGNLTSQFFANVYLNELDQFVKHKLKVKYYIRYVDDFVILHSSKEQLELWKREIELFLKEKLRLEFHPDKTRILNLSHGIDFVGFRNFYNYKLLRKRNVKIMNRKIDNYNNEKISLKKLFESFEGWNAYAKWGNSYKIKKKLIQKIKFN